MGKVFEFLVEIWGKSILTIFGIAFMIDGYEPFSKWKTFIGLLLITSQQGINKWLDSPLA